MINIRGSVCIFKLSQKIKKCEWWYVAFAGDISPFVRYGEFTSYNIYYMQYFKEVRI